MTAATPDTLVRAFVVHIETGERPGSGERDGPARLGEACRLAAAMDLDIAGSAIVSLRTVVPATLIGSGQVERLGADIADARCELAIVNGQLSPVQQRNLERAWSAKVLDRTGLILEIFGRRAKTREGRLQVDLAHLRYQYGRLVRSWTHLERQRGGSGFMGGPGETQIESDRRAIQQRITGLERKLDTVRRTRGLHRGTRRQVPVPVVALVGYTNAGKSTLFNRLTRATVIARDQLFATLDPTMRAITLPHGRTVILSDTVGFISDLPTTLIAAFRATLEEVISADLIVHVRDMSHGEADAQARDVEAVLVELGIKAVSPANCLEVWNKTDLMSAEERAVLGERALREPAKVLTSAVTGQGSDRLLECIEQALSAGSRHCRIDIAPEDGAGAAWLYRYAEVLDRTIRDDGSQSLAVRLSDANLARAQRRFASRLTHFDRPSQLLEIK